MKKTAILSFKGFFPFTALMWLLVSATQMLNPTQATAQITPDGARGAILVKPGDPIPKPGDYIGRWVIFTDNEGGLSGIRLYDTKGGNSVFNKVELQTIAEDGISSGELIAYHSNDKYFIIKEKDGKNHTYYAEYPDMLMALTFLDEANNSDKHSRNFSYNLHNNEFFFEVSIERNRYYLSITNYIGNETDLIIPAQIMKIPVTSIFIDFTFKNPQNIISITIPNNVTKIYDRYENHGLDNFGNLTAIYVDTTNTKYSSVNGVLYNKDKTTLIFHPPKNTMGAFVIPNSVIRIGKQAFRNNSLSSVTIPNSVTTIENEAFFSCNNLSSITIPSSVTTIGTGAFRSGGIIAINVNAANSAFSSADGVLYDKNRTTLVSYPAKKNGAFIIPSNVTKITDWAFSNCSGLTSVTIPSSVTIIPEYAFFNCRGLTSVTITSGVTQIMKSAFEDCSGLTSVTIPSSVTIIPERAFYNCRGLTSVTITSGVTQIMGSAFSDCTGLTSVTIPTSVTWIVSGAFYNCKSLTRVTFQGPVDPNQEYLLLDLRFNFRDLWDKYFGTGGGPGTYTRLSGGNVWTKR
jgi:hypothetical protein